MRLSPFLFPYLAALMLNAGCASSCNHADLRPATQQPASREAAREIPGTGNAPLLDTQPAASANPAVPEPAPHDIWQRLRPSFSLPETRDTRVDREIEHYLRHPDYLDRVQKRAALYLHHLVEEIECRGMPGEIALLPIVESAFQPFAYSPGRAAGIWQFTPATGRAYGLKQNWWYDGRRDIPESTRAALDYLQDLNTQFDGDWFLALAAYNSGATRVRKAIRKNRASNKATDFWALDLPRETRAYVPRLLATVRLFSKPEEHGVKLRTIPDAPYFALVGTGSQIDLALAADVAGIPLQELYRLNPGFNRWATDPDGPHRLLVPVDKTEHFRRQVAALPASERVRWRHHKIRSGETLSHIARKFDTSISLLRQVNQLQGTRIRAGRHVLVPLSSQSLDGYTLSATQRLHALQSRDRDGQKLTHTVMPGDTLWDIARKYRISTKKLAAWNGISPLDMLRPGQKLTLWIAPGSAPRDGDARLMPATLSMTNMTNRTIRYTVRKGDSLYRIAKRFNIRIRDIRRWNQLGDGPHLSPGQKLTLKVDVTKQVTRL